MSLSETQVAGLRGPAPIRANDISQILPALGLKAESKDQTGTNFETRIVGPWYVRAHVESHEKDGKGNPVFRVTFYLRHDDVEQAIGPVHRVTSASALRLRGGKVMTLLFGLVDDEEQLKAPDGGWLCLKASRAATGVRGRFTSTTDSSWEGNVDAFPALRVYN